jgi:hypothetical protein
MGSSGPNRILIIQNECIVQTVRSLPPVAQSPPADQMATQVTAPVRCDTICSGVVRSHKDEAMVRDQIKDLPCVRGM